MHVYLVIVLIDSASLQSSEGAHLSWEPPANNAGTITEYSVYLGLKPAPGTVPGTMAFARVYCGPGSSCVVSHNQLASAHIDTTSKPAIIFRIAAKNDKGYVAGGLDLEPLPVIFVCVCIM